MVPIETEASVTSLLHECGTVANGFHRKKITNHVFHIRMGWLPIFVDPLVECILGALGVDEFGSKFAAKFHQVVVGNVLVDAVLVILVMIKALRVKVVLLQPEELIGHILIAIAIDGSCPNISEIVGSSVAFLVVLKITGLGLTGHQVRGEKDRKKGSSQHGGAWVLLDGATNACLCTGGRGGGGTIAVWDAIECG